MSSHITSVEGIEEEAIEIDGYLSIECSDNIDEICERGSRLAVLINRTGKLLADSKWHKDEQLKSSIMETLRLQGLHAGMSATTANKMIDANCKHINYLVNWTDRLNRTATHQLDYLRTLISMAKAEMYNRL